MAPPATKRRKLEHSDSEGESDNSLTAFDQTNGVPLSGSDAEPSADDSDVAMEELEGLEDSEDEDEEEDMEDDDDDDVKEDDGEGEGEGEGENDFEDETAVHESRKQTAAGKTASAQKPQKRTTSALQDGVYTAETFKSNMFKLQVDELLEQVKPKYGKKEAPAENAMRTLKTMIEQIPSRDALSVCCAGSVTEMR